MSLVDPWRNQIAEWVRQGLSGVRMLELARDDVEQPYRGCDSVWRAAVRRQRLVLEHEQAVADVPIRFEGLPGEYLQVDWGEIRHFTFTQQAEGRRYFLACRLKYSRWVWVRFTTDMRQETLFPRPPPGPGRGRPRVKRVNVRWLCLRPPDQLDRDECRALEEILLEDERLNAGYALLQQFRRLITRRSVRDLEHWLKKAVSSGLRPFVNLAHGGFADAWAEGESMTIAQASAEILEAG